MEQIVEWVLDEVDVEYFGETKVILDFTLRRASENDELQVEAISAEIELLTKKGCSLFCITWFVSNADLLLFFFVIHPRTLHLSMVSIVRYTNPRFSFPLLLFISTRAREIGWFSERLDLIVSVERRVDIKYFSGLVQTRPVRN